MGEQSGRGETPDRQAPMPGGTGMGGDAGSEDAGGAFRRKPWGTPGATVGAAGRPPGHFEGAARPPPQPARTAQSRSRRLPPPRPIP